MWTHLVRENEPEAITSLLVVCFGATASNIQGLFLSLCSEVTPNSAGDPARISLMQGKLSSVLSLWLCYRILSCNMNIHITNIRNKYI